jgi:hypothetical protein
MAIDLETTNGPSFKPPSAAANPCSFELKLDFANAGLSAEYRELWTKVQNVSGNLYQESPPPPQTKWFSELMDFTVDSEISNKYKTLQDKYHPDRIYPLHPALNPIWYQPDSFYGSPRGQTRKGLRDPYYRPVVEINPSLPPLINLFNKYKSISDELTGKSQKLVPSQPFVNSSDFKENLPFSKPYSTPNNLPVITI